MLYELFDQSYPPPLDHVKVKIRSGGFLFYTSAKDALTGIGK